jgi:hypothetical protein
MLFGGRSFLDAARVGTFAVDPSVFIAANDGGLTAMR